MKTFFNLKFKNGWILVILVVCLEKIIEMPLKDAFLRCFWPRLKRSRSIELLALNKAKNLVERNLSMLYGGR